MIQTRSPHTVHLYEATRVVYALSCAIRPSEQGRLVVPRCVSYFENSSECGLWVEYLATDFPNPTWIAFGGSSALTSVGVGISGTAAGVLSSNRTSGGSPSSYKGRRLGRIDGMLL